MPEIEQQLPKLAKNPNRRSIYIQVNLAKNLIDLVAYQDQTEQIPELLNTALLQAQNIQDQEARSYALGILGYWYEQRQQWFTAKYRVA